LLPPRPELKIAYSTAVTGETGQIWIMDRPILIQGTGVEATPVSPDFFSEPPPQHWITPVVDRLVQAVDTGKLLCTGQDYHQALEIAIALTQSAHRNHERIHLPLQDRALKIYPSPYRLHGGDVTGWLGNSATPQVE